MLYCLGHVSDQRWRNKQEVADPVRPHLSLHLGACLPSAPRRAQEADLHVVLRAFGPFGARGPHGLRPLRVQPKVQHRDGSCRAGADVGSVIRGATLARRLAQHEAPVGSVTAGVPRARCWAWGGLKGSMDSLELDAGASTSNYRLPGLGLRLAHAKVC